MKGRTIMEKGQNQFFDWILERAQDGKQEELIELLKHNFEQQNNGTFNQDELAESTNKMFSLIKPEYIDELKQAMEHFKGNM